MLRDSVYQNITLRGHRDNTKNYPEVGLVVLLIQEILYNYYSIESREGTKTSFRMPHDISFQFINFCFDFVVFRGKL